MICPAIREAVSCCFAFRRTFSLCYITVDYTFGFSLLSVSSDSPALLDGLDKIDQKLHLV
jgi:hypothetical protein